MMLDVDFSEDGIQIKQEGRFEKLVDHVQQISYNGKLAFARGQTMYFVTERAVFRLCCAVYEVKALKLTGVFPVSVYNELIIGMDGKRF